MSWSYAKLQRYLCKVVGLIMWKTQVVCEKFLGWTCVKAQVCFGGNLKRKLMGTGVDHK